MDKSYTYEMLEPIIREKISMDAEVTIWPKGTSMLPMIRQGIDQVVLKKPEGRLKKYDVIFYKRDNGQFVLHRIVKVRKNDYVLCGDNQIDYEYGITDDMVIAVMSAFIHDSEIIKPDNEQYLEYSRNHVRKQFRMRVKSKIKKSIKRLLGIS